jgi:hypothetical protein
MNKNNKNHNIIHNKKSVRFHNKVSLSVKILAIINSNPRQEYSAKTIDQVLEGEYNYLKDEKRIAKIRTELNRLADRAKIRRKIRGCFQAKATLETIAMIETPETKLHGIKIEVKKMEGISAEHSILDWLKSKHFRKITNARGTSLKRYTKEVGWRDRWATITVHESGLVEIFLGCSKLPLSYPEFCSFCDFLDGFFEPYYFTKNNAYLIQVGMGKDFEEMHLDGVTCIRLHKFKNDWCSIYENDEGRVRFEHHLKLNITLEDAINIMSLITTPPRYLHNNVPDEKKDVT